MPTNVVKTQADEEKWQKAKAIAAAKGEEENYAYIMGIYKRMNPERFAAARVADRYASSPLIKELDEDYHSLWHDRAEAAGEGWTCSLKEGVDPCGKMTLKEFIAKWKKHGLKAVKVQRLPTTYSYYDCSSHATLRTEQMHGVSRGNLRDLELDWNTPIPWSKAKKGDWVKWPNHHGVVIDPKRKIVESCWGVDGWVFQHPVDLSTYGGKPTVHSVRLKEKTASSDGQCRVASSPFSELSPEGAEAFGSFCASLTHWLGMAQYENLNVMYRIWKGSKELQGWLSRHVNKSSYTLYYGRRITDNEKTVSVGDILSRKGRGKVFYWSTDLKRASGFATVVGPTDQTDFQSAVGEAKVSGKKVIVDVDRLISFCTRHKEDVARLTWGDAVGLLTGGGDYEGEVLTTPVNATVIRAEFYADPKRKKEAAPSSVSVRLKEKTASSDGQCIVGGQCFRYAVMWDGKGPGSSPDDIVVHGNVRGLVGPHAWIERKDGRVFDWQTVEGIWETLGRQPDPSYTKRGWPKREFYAEFKPRKMKRYTAEDALINGIRNRHYGPWDADEEYRPPIRSASRVAARYLMASRRQRR